LLTNRKEKNKFVTRVVGYKNIITLNVNILIIKMIFIHPLFEQLLDICFFFLLLAHNVSTRDIIKVVTK